MTIKGALSEGIRILKEADIEAPAVDAGAVMCHVLGCDRVYLYTKGDMEVPEDILGEFFRMVGMRAKGMPLSYITGRKEFMSLSFKVTPDTLIPRPETEILVESVIEQAKKWQGFHTGEGMDLRILDIGTGSGCIAVSLAYYIKAKCRITAVDISEKALEVAEENALQNGVRQKIEFRESDLFSCLDRGREKYDIIVSNPPYIAEDEIQRLQREVRDYEPALALNGGRDGLDFYKRITAEAPEFLKPGGMLFLEAGYGQAHIIAEMMRKKFNDIRIIPDLSHIDRVVTGKRL